MMHTVLLPKYYSSIRTFSDFVIVLFVSNSCMWDDFFFTSGVKSLYTAHF